MVGVKSGPDNNLEIHDLRTVESLEIVVLERKEITSLMKELIKVKHNQQSVNGVMV